MNELCENDIALRVSIACTFMCCYFDVVVDFQWDIAILLLVDKLIEKVLSCNAQQEPFMVCFGIH